MKKWILGLACALVISAAGSAAANDHFDAGMKAAMAKDYETALDRFEAALMQEPDNLQFGNEYRQTVIKIEAYERCIAFFEKLVADHPNAANLWMNYGYAHVDKIPSEGAITQVLLANTALGFFTSSLELKATWLGHFTRGSSYVYWPAIFGRTPLAIEDLEKATALSDKMPQKDYHHRAWMALGDAYWRLEDLEKAREIWKKTHDRYPGQDGLEKRMTLEGEALDTYMTEFYDPARRVDTDLRILWEE